VKCALERGGFADVSFRRLPLGFRAPAGRFAEHFRAFAAGAGTILDKQPDEVLKEICAFWNTQLEECLVDGAYDFPDALARRLCSPRGLTHRTIRSTRKGPAGL